jgi:hypothetical protein
VKAAWRLLSQPREFMFLLYIQLENSLEVSSLISPERAQPSACMHLFRFPGMCMVLFLSLVSW